MLGEGNPCTKRGSGAVNRSSKAHLNTRLKTTDYIEGLQLPSGALVALGTRPSNESHWFSTMLDGGGESPRCRAGTLNRLPSIQPDRTRKARFSTCVTPDGYTRPDDSLVPQAAGTAVPRRLRFRRSARPTHGNRAGDSSLPGAHPIPAW